MASTPGQSLEEQCQQVAKQITDKEAELEALRTNKEDPDQQAFLRDSIKQLRDSIKQLREKELLLLRQTGQNAGTSAAQQLSGASNDVLVAISTKVDQLAISTKVDQLGVAAEIKELKELVQTKLGMSPPLAKESPITLAAEHKALDQRIRRRRAFNVV